MRKRRLSEDEPGDPVDRKYWEARGSKKSLDLMDAVVALIPKETPDVRIKYNRGHVALGTSGTNFCWFHPRKGRHIHFIVKPGADTREKLIATLEDKGIESGPHKSKEMKVVLTMKELNENRDLIRDLIMMAEQKSRK